MRIILLLNVLLSFHLYGQHTITVEGKIAGGETVLLYKNRTQISTHDANKNGKYKITGLLPGNTYNLHFLNINNSDIVQKSVFFDLEKGTLNENAVLQLNVSLEPIKDYSSIDVFYEPIAIIRIHDNHFIEFDRSYHSSQSKKIEAFKISNSASNQDKQQIDSIPLLRTVQVTINGLVLDESGRPIKNQTFNIIYQDDKFKETGTSVFSTNEYGAYSVNIKVHQNCRLVFSMPQKVTYHIRVSPNLKTDFAKVSTQTVNVVLKSQTSKMINDLYNFSVSYFGGTHHFVNVPAQRYIQRYELNHSDGFKSQKKALTYLKKCLLKKEITPILNYISTYADFTNHLNKKKLSAEKRKSYDYFYRSKTIEKDQNKLVKFQQLLKQCYARMNATNQPNLNWEKADYKDDQDNSLIQDKIVTYYTLSFSQTNILRIGLIQVDSGWKFFDIGDY